MTGHRLERQGRNDPGQHDQTNGFALYSAAHARDVDNVVRPEFGQHEAAVGDLAQQALGHERLGCGAVGVPRGRMLLAHPGVAKKLAGPEVPRQDTASQVLHQDLDGAKGHGFGVGVEILNLLHCPDR